jgi:hypothetical protein
VSDLLSLCTANATWHLAPCAEVRVGDHVTRYVRRGTGPSVVLVGADATVNPLWVPLVERLETGHRVVAPQPPPADADVATWLRGFIEGLGLSSVVLIAGNGSSAAALEVATADDFLVRKVVIMPQGDDPVSAVETERTLVVPSDATNDESLKRIETFIA